MEEFTAESIRIIFFFLSSIVLLRFILIFIFYGIPLFKNKKNHSRNKPTEHTPPVSIIVYAHQASKDLKENIPFLMQQDYPEFEVIVVNDESGDNTDDILEQLSKKYPKLKHTFVPNTTRHLSRKKLSTSIGIKTAKYDTLLFTEAFCRPRTNLWIKEMVSQITPSKNVVIGYSIYPNSKSLSDHLFGYYRFLNGIKMISSALRSKPFIATNENLLYTKNFFFRNNGFADYLFLEAGEDDLFINKNASKKETAVCYSPNSLVENRQQYKNSFKKNTYFDKISTYKYLRTDSKIGYKIEESLYWLCILVTIATITVGIYFENFPLLIIACFLYLIPLISKMLLFHFLAKNLRQPFNAFSLLIFNWLLPFKGLWNKAIYLSYKKEAYTYSIKK